jgi:hypothetical protein
VTHARDDIYKTLDPIKVAKLVAGYGLDAAIGRWGHLGKSTVTDALREGRRLLGGTDARGRTGPRTGSRDVKPAA